MARAAEANLKKSLLIASLLAVAHASVTSTTRRPADRPNEPDHNDKDSTMPNEAASNAHRAAKDFARANLAACSQEILVWRRKGTLPEDSKMRELGQLCALYLQPTDTELRVAEDLVFIAALEACATAIQSAVVPFGAPAVPGWTDPDHRD